MIEFSVRRPVAVLMICIGIIVLGTIAAQRIPMQLLPDIQAPEVSVITDFRGATPEEIESLVSTPIERSVSTIAGLLRVTSTSERERSEVRLVFNAKLDFLEMVSILREKLDAAGLPEGTGKPKIVRVQAGSEPVIRISIKKKNENLSQFELARILQDTLVRKLESVEGVALANLLGAPSKQLEIIVDPNAALSYNIQLSSIPDLLQSQNKSYSAGEVKFEGQSTSVRLGQSIKSIEELKSLIVKRDRNKNLRLVDIAQIREVIQKPNIRTHLQADESLVIEVRKDAEANTVKVADGVKEVLEVFNEENKADLEIKILFDQGKEIKASIDDVSHSVRDGGILAAIVIFIMLQEAWPSFAVTVSIPLSLMITLILMYFTNITFNLMSLAGLAIGVGMLVDNSTVVLQNINAQGLLTKDRRQAALWGAQKVSGAIIASTLATVAVFGPLAFVEGSIGKIFRDVAATICFSMIASLLVAVMVIPMMSAISFSPQFNFKAKEKKIQNYLSRLYIFNLMPLYSSGFKMHIADFFKKQILVFKVFSSVLRDLVSQLLIFCAIEVKKRFHAFYFHWIEPSLAVFAQAFLNAENFLGFFIPKIIKDSRSTLQWALWLTVAGISVLALRGAELFPDEPNSRLIYDLEFLPGQIVDVTESQTSKIEKEILKIRGVSGVSSTIGANGSYRSKLMISTEGVDSLELSKKINAYFLKIPDLSFNRQKEALIGEGKPIQIEIYNEDLSALKKQTNEVKQLVQRLEGLLDVESNLKPDVSEINVVFAKDRLNWFNLDSQSFISTLKPMLTGLGAGNLNFRGEDLVTRVSIASDYFSSIEKIKYFNLPQEDEKRVYLSQVSDIEENKVEGAIYHSNRKRMSIVSANLFKEDLEGASRKIQSLFKNEIKDKSFKFKMGGQDDERKKSTRSLLVAVGLSIFLIYLMLAAQFENLIQPIIVLFAVPMCLSGVAVFLLLFNLNISALVFVGFIILVGSSVNTSIVMVDFANQLRLEGKSLTEAITEATKRRMRPILVTSAANILGLVPMALSFGEQGSSMQRPLAVTLIGGHLSSTILTMIVVPIIYVRMTKGEARAEG